MAIKTWAGAKPESCDLCGNSLQESFVDGKTITGAWGIMCMSCHSVLGSGLGMGRGQKYDLETLYKVEG